MKNPWQVNFPHKWSWPHMRYFLISIHFWWKFLKYHFYSYVCEQGPLYTIKIIEQFIWISEGMRNCGRWLMNVKWTWRNSSRSLKEIVVILTSQPEFPKSEYLRLTLFSCYDVWIGKLEKGCKYRNWTTQEYQPISMYFEIEGVVLSRCFLKGTSQFYP